LSSDCLVPATKRLMEFGFWSQIVMAILFSAVRTDEEHHMSDSNLVLWKLCPSLNLFSCIFDD